MDQNTSARERPTSFVMQDPFRPQDPWSSQLQEDYLGQLLSQTMRNGPRQLMLPPYLINNGNESITNLNVHTEHRASLQPVAVVGRMILITVMSMQWRLMALNGMLPLQKTRFGCTMTPQNLVHRRLRYTSFSNPKLLPPAIPVFTAFHPSMRRQIRQARHLFLSLVSLHRAILLPAFNYLADIPQLHVRIPLSTLFPRLF